MQKAVKCIKGLVKIGICDCYKNQALYVNYNIKYSNCTKFGGSNKKKGVQECSKWQNSLLGH